MKKRYITFYKFYLSPIPHFKSHGILLTDRWLSCFLLGIGKMFKGEITFFTVDTPRKKYKLPFR